MSGEHEDELDALDALLETALDDFDCGEGKEVETSRKEEEELGGADGGASGLPEPCREEPDVARPLYQWARVRLQGLVARPELNGRIAVLHSDGPMGTHRRWSIVLEPESAEGFDPERDVSVIRVKEANLCLLPQKNPGMPPKKSQKEKKVVAKNKRRQPKREGRNAGAGAGAGPQVAADEAGRKAEAERLLQLSIMHREGMFGVEQSDEQSVRYCRLAAEMGFAVAQQYLGVFYHTGNGVTQDFAEAARWFRLASNQGSKEAHYNLAQMYQNGIGVPQDSVEAARLYRLGADAGDADAQYQLGHLFRIGDGVGQDYAEAARWFQLAEAQGDGDAQCALGSLHLYGDGVPKNQGEALRLFELAAAQGMAPAFLSLGAMYENGWGVEKNVALAKQYYRRAGKDHAKGGVWDNGQTAGDFMMESLDFIKHMCASCETVGDGLKVCTRCKGPRYCSVACQKKDWPEHKRVCQRLAKDEYSHRMARDSKNG